MNFIEAVLLFGFHSILVLLVFSLRVLWKTNTVSFARKWPKPRERFIFPLLAFAAPLGVRGVPDVLMGSYLVGFDLMAYYVPYTLKWLSRGVSFWFLMAEAPLFWVVLMQTTEWGVPITLTLKVLPSLLHGFLGLAIYVYAERVLGWGRGKALASTVFVTVYFTALRVSWDLLRNQLALAFLFLTLTLLHVSGEKRGLRYYCALSIAMAFVVLTHQLVAAIMFAVVVMFLVSTLIGKRYDNARRLLIACAVPGFLFLLELYAARVVNPEFMLFSSEIVDDSLVPNVAESCTELALETLKLLAFYYLPILPMALLGVRKLGGVDLKAWVLCCLAVTLMPLIPPYVSLNQSYRWGLMLTYPLTLYAFEGLVNLNARLPRLDTSIAVVFLVGLLASGFVFMPNRSPLIYYNMNVNPLYNTAYTPSSMLQNTIPLDDCHDAVQALKWLENNGGEDFVVLAHVAFQGWASLVLNRGQVFSYGFGKPEERAMEMSQQGYDFVYLIWWTNGEGWYGQPSASSTFKEIFKSGRIAIYNYQPMFRDKSTLKWSWRR